MVTGKIATPHRKADGYNIVWGAGFFNVLSMIDTLNDVFESNGFKNTTSVSIHTYDAPEFGATWSLQAPFLKHPIQFQITETEDEYKEDLYFELFSGLNTLTDNQTRWLLSHLMTLVVEGSSDGITQVARNMLQNSYIPAERLRWEQ